MRSIGCRAIVLLIGAMTAGCGPGSPGPKAQALLSRYAPGLRLGERISDSEKQAYHLQVAPYLGYRDQTFRASHGVHDLMIQVDENVDEGHPVVSPDARIASVAMLVDSAATTSVEADFRQSLGTPEIRCYESDATGPWRELYWPGADGRGVLLSMASRGAGSRSTRGFVETAVKFGAEGPASTRIATVRCP